jgi:predicted RNase H-like nuclease
MVLKPRSPVVKFWNNKVILHIMKKISGVDGCRGGWLSFHFDGKKWSENLFKKINELYSASDSKLVLIDIPIGLRTNESNERLCDLEARKILEKRKSSIFPAPSRLAIHCNEYRLASQKNKEATGRGLSKQTFSIIPKIREVDNFIRSEHYNPRKKRIREVHPEVCFWGLNGCSEMEYKKKSALGICARMRVLADYIKDGDKIFDKTRGRYKKNQVADDDIIDALVCAVTALFNGSLSTFPLSPETDTKGIPMEIVYYQDEKLK